MSKKEKRSDRDHVHKDKHSNKDLDGRREHRHKDRDKRDKRDKHNHHKERDKYDKHDKYDKYDKRDRRDKHHKRRHDDGDDSDNNQKKKERKKIPYHKADYSSSKPSEYIPSNLSVSENDGNPRVYVTGLNPLKATLENVSQLFGQIGRIKADKRNHDQPKIKFYFNQNHEKSGDCTITYDDCHTAPFAIEWFNNTQFLGQTICVQMADPPKTKEEYLSEKRNGRGRGRGGFGRGGFGRGGFGRGSFGRGGGQRGGGRGGHGFDRHSQRGRGRGNVRERYQPRKQNNNSINSRSRSRSRDRNRKGARHDF